MQTNDRSKSTFRSWLWLIGASAVLLAGLSSLSESAIALRQGFDPARIETTTGDVSESSPSIARAWPPGGRWYGALVTYRTAAGEPYREWVFGLEHALSPGALVALGRQWRRSARLASASRKEPVAPAA